MAEYQKTIITNAGISILNRVLASKTTVTFTRAVSSTDDLSNKTESELRAMTSFGSIMQNGVCSRYNVHNQNMVSLDLVFTNENLGNSYMINTVGLYAKASDSSTEVLYAIARAGKDTKGNNLAEQMPAYSGGLTKFTISLYTQVGQASSVSVSIIDEGVVKSVNGTIKPDANGNIILPFQSQAEANQLRTDLTNNINNTAATLTATITKNKADADSKLETEANTRAQNDNAFNNRLNALSDALTSETVNRKNDIDSKVSNIQIGGRNLLRNTRALDSDVWLFREAWPKASYSYQGCQVRGSDVTVWNGFSQYIEVSGGETYIFSIDVKSADGGSYSDAAFYVSLNLNDGYTRAQASGDNEIFIYDADWKRLSFVTHITSNGYIRPRIERTSAAGGKIVFARPKLEKGNLATDWSPAPEDLEEGIASTTATANEAKAKAEANANSIQALSDKLNNTSGYTAITRTVGVDLNGFIELGSFYFPSSAGCVNLPEGNLQSSTHSDICVENRKVGGTIIQKCYYVDLYGTVYIRTTSTNGGIWNSWARIDGLYLNINQ